MINLSENVERDVVLSLVNSLFLPLLEISVQPATNGFPKCICVIGTSIYRTHDYTISALYQNKMLELSQNMTATSPPVALLQSKYCVQMYFSYILVDLH